MTPRPSPRKPSAFATVIESIGSRICKGEIPPGTIMTVEALEAQTGASRSVVRESVRVLASKGLLRPRQRIGLEVLGESEWRLFDPQVIRWKLESPKRQRHIDELRELRMAIEPEAARLAAHNASPALAGEIISAAGQLWAAGVDGGHEDFLVRDASFHRLVLRASGNDMFGHLADTVSEALRDRTVHELDQEPLSLADIQLHVDLANQIQRRQADRAWTTMREIVSRTNSESASPTRRGTP